MPAARGVKRAASKSSAAAAPTVPKNKKKRGAVQLEIPSAPKARGRVLTCGQGDVGQLGLGEDVSETTKFQYVTALGDKIVEVCAGGMHTVALDTSGKVWTFGCNDEGALGRRTGGDADEARARPVALPARGVALAAGDSHSAALLQGGDVYAWGAFRDSHGSMGLIVRGREGKACREPVKVDIGEPAVAIASGGDHLVILSTSGSVYTMGCGEQGQLGRLPQRSASRDTRQGFSPLLVPSKVNLKGTASRVWAGYHATFILDANNDKVFAFGLNNYGQLGITGEKRKTALYSPMECDAFNRHGSRWKQVACGQHHSLALDDSGQVYSIGRCEYGRLGLGDRSGDAEVLEPIPKLQNKKCVSIAAGTSNSFAVTDSGEVFSWGMGSEGQLGTGGAADAAEPARAECPQPQPAPPAPHAPPTERAARTPAPDLMPVRIAAGGQHTVLLVEDPSSEKEASPAPDKEIVEEAEESTEEEQELEVEPDQEPEEEERQPPLRKRQRKQQEEEVSSTSSAQPSEVGEDKPPKVNGDEKKEIPMDVDVTDKPQETKEETPKEDKEMDQDQDQDQEQEPEPEQEDKEPSKPETTDTSSQETTDSETKSQDDEKTIDKNDVDMKDDSAEVNGTPESQIVEAKSVEPIVSTPLTTTA